MMNTRELARKLDEFPRQRFAYLPTRMEFLRNLSNELGGPRIFIKRDDQIGLGIGGNKTRKLEFLLGDALSKGMRKVVTFGGPQSNHARQTVAAARKVGLEPILFLFGEEPEEYTGNLLLDRLMGATIHFIPFESGAKKLEEAVEDMKAEALSFPEVSAEDSYLIPVGGESPVGLLGYVAAALEISMQAEDKGIDIDYVVVAAGTGGTVAGLTAGFKLLGAQTKVVGVDVGALWKDFKPSIAASATLTARQIQPEVTVEQDDFVLVEGFVGDGYAIPSKEGVEAISLLARHEGIFLDPVYTGKGMAGLIGLVRQGFFKGSDNVLFVHTGGVPALFAMSREVLSLL
jgi:L-cysteate sulfo-lyase